MRERPLATRESEALQQMRDALEAVAVAPPAAYRLRRGEAGNWCVGKPGQPDACFASRSQALAAARLAVIRCSAYCLHLQEEDGRIQIECLNWPVDEVGTPPDWGQDRRRPATVGGKTAA